MYTHSNILLYRGATEFCTNADENLWVNACKTVLDSLYFTFKKFGDVYLNYHAFTHTAAISKCRAGSVEIAKRHLFLYKDITEHLTYIEQTPESVIIEQHMAICHARRAVISETRPRKSETDIKEMIAINATGISGNDSEIVVFHKKGNKRSNTYVLYKVYWQNFSSCYAKNFNRELFIQIPPTRVQTNFKQLFEEYEIILTDP